MKKEVATAIAILAVLFCSMAMADWSGGAHIMHEVQWPEGSEDIMVDVGDKQHIMLADDWVYTTAYPVRDAHIWVSWYNDYVGGVSEVELALYTNAADGAGGFQPGTEVWRGSFAPTQFSYVPWETGGADDHNWVNPFAPAEDLGPVDDLDGNHGDIYQINIADLTDSTESTGSLALTVGETYWLGVVISVLDTQTGDQEDPWMGWHTAGTTYGSDAMWLNQNPDPNVTDEDPLWQDIPNSQDYDLAFVMTPEPSALALLVLAGVTMASWRKRRF